MTRILVVYASDYGNTKKMAEVIAAGVETVPGAEPVLRAAETVSAEDLLTSDGIIFGSPVHMGSMDWRIKKLIDSLCGGMWMKNSLVGKVGAVFATGSGHGHAGSGAELTLLSMLNNFAELGMVIVPLPKSTPGYAQSGLQWGAWSQSADENLKPIGLSDAGLVAARHHGANVARVAEALKGKTLFAG
ncbi:MAG: hypothetical protein GYA46_04395 [candidate division Zixibacteria bacterium]|nr:hypothetical protein [candidate division Zixibacteria bacterium]